MLDLSTCWCTETSAVAVFSGRTRRTLFLLVQTLSIAVRAARTGLPVPARARRTVVAGGTDLALTRLGTPVALWAEVARNGVGVVDL